METDYLKLWPIEQKITFLNHGSFGCCPVAALEFRKNLIEQLERQPVRFLVRELEERMDEARATLAKFVGAEPDNLVFIPNATAGVNTVLRSLAFNPGDELLVTDHEYNACRNALDFAAQRSGVKVVVAHIPFPVKSSQEIIDSILSAVTPRTRLALIDHVTSPTALVLPMEKIVPALQDRGIDVLVDGAHAPGMVPLNLAALGAAYYTGNCHKWLCSPKTAALLYVRGDRQHLIHPLSISHGLNSTRSDRSKFLLEFGWTGTSDPTACLTVPYTIQYLEKLVFGGWPAIMQRNRLLALDAQKIISRALGIAVPCPMDCVGSMAAFPIRDRHPDDKVDPITQLDPLQDELWVDHKIEVPVVAWPKAPKRMLRVSAQLYNSRAQYEFLARVLPAAVRDHAVLCT